MENKSSLQNAQRAAGEYVSKEQLCKICHISKRAAKFYLDNGFIPCEISDSATHKYRIKKTDVKAFIRRRERHPELYSIRHMSGGRKTLKAKANVEYSPKVFKKYRRLLENDVSAYPDLMSTRMVSELTGYSVDTVLKWAGEAKLRWFSVGAQSCLSKVQLLDFMMSERFRGIKVKSRKREALLRMLSEKADN